MLSPGDAVECLGLGATPWCKMLIQANPRACWRRSRSRL